MHNASGQTGQTQSTTYIQNITVKEKDKVKTKFCPKLLNHKASSAYALPTHVPDKQKIRFPESGNLKKYSKQGSKPTYQGPNKYAILEWNCLGYNLINLYRSTTFSLFFSRLFFKLSRQ